MRKHLKVALAGLVIALAVFGISVFAFKRVGRLDRESIQSVQQARNESATRWEERTSSTIKSDRAAPKPIDREARSVEVRILYRTAAPSLQPGELVVSQHSQEEGEGIDRLHRSLVSEKWRGPIVPNQTATLTELPPGIYTISARVPGYLQDDCRIHIDGMPIDMKRNLTEASKIICHVVNELGAPISSAKVRMLPSNKMGIVAASQLGEISPHSLPVEQETDALGASIFASPSAELSRLHIIPPVPYAELILWDVSPGADLIAVVAHGASLRGQVSDGSGEPIGDCNVAVYTQESSGSEVPIGSTKTDESGWFRLEQMDTRANAWIVFAEKASWEMKKSVVRNPHAGKVYPLDFELRNATAGAFRLLSTAGDAISGVGVHLKGSNGSEVPFTWITDRSGRFVTGPHLVPPLQYEMQCVVGGIVTGIGRLDSNFAAGSAQTKEIIISNMGIVQLSKAAVGQTIEIELAGTFPAMIKQWEAPFEPLWLPVGDYLATAFTAGELVAQESLQVRANQTTQLELASSEAALEFLMEAGVEHYVGILSKTNIVVWEHGSARGSHVVKLPSGQYYFTCYSEPEGSWDTALFTLGSEGLNYGVLSAKAICTGSFVGTVSGSDGLPIQSVIITATSLDGYRSAKAESDVDGRYELRGLALGKYEVNCDLYALTGLHAPLIKKLGVIVEHSGSAVLDFVCDAGREIVVRLPLSAAGASTGFALGQHCAQFESIDASGVFKVYAPGPEAIVGTHFSPNVGMLAVFAIRVAGQPALIDLRESGDAERRIVVVQEGEQSEIGFSAAIEMQGMRLGSSVFDKEGKLEVLMTTTEDLELVVTNKAGLLRRFPLRGMSKIVMDESVAPKQTYFSVVAESSSGHSKISIYVECCEMRRVLSEGEPIQPRCDREAHSVAVDAPGYVGLLVTAASGDQLTLRRAAAVRHIDASRVSPGAHTLVVRNLDTRDPVLVVGVSSEGMAELPEIPAGDYYLEVLDSSSVVLLGVPVHMAAEGPSSIAL